MGEQTLFISSGAVEALERNSDMIETIESLSQGLCEALCKHVRSSRIYVPKDRMQLIMTEVLQDCINKMYGFSNTCYEKKNVLSDQEKKFFDSMRKEIFRFYKNDLLKEYDEETVEKSFEYFLKSGGRNWIYLSYKNGLREMCEMAKEEILKHNE